MTAGAALDPLAHTPRGVCARCAGGRGHRAGQTPAGARGAHQTEGVVGSAEVRGGLDEEVEGAVAGGVRVTVEVLGPAPLQGVLHGWLVVAALGPAPLSVEDSLLVVWLDEGLLKPGAAGSLPLAVLGPLQQELGRQPGGSQAPQAPEVRLDRMAV